MLRRTLIAALVATAIAPFGSHAQDWENDYDDQWADERPPDYDVSVDVGVSGGVTFDTFYAPLGAHGEWVSAGAYGRVWRPHVAAGWRPYYYGRWEWTSEGWFWVSDEPWGWAAYHYGRWAFDGVYGWVWIPGYQWAPAWVAWRWSGDVVGWAPLAPGLSVYVTSYPFYAAWWTFVPSVSFVSVPVYSVAYAPHYTRHHYDHTTPAPARPAPRPVPGRAHPAPAASPAWGGPAPRAIEARMGRPLRPSRVVAAPSPAAARARPGEIAVYRPGARGAPGRGWGRPEAFGRIDDRGRAAPSVPGRGDERGNAFAPPARRGESSSPVPRGWGRPERVTPGPVQRERNGAAPERRSESSGPGWTRPERVNPSPVQRGERNDAAPARRSDGGQPTPRGWSRPQRVEQGGGAPARAPEARGRSGSERTTTPGSAQGGAWRSGGQGGGAGGQAPARPQQQPHGGSRPAPTSPRR